MPLNGRETRHSAAFFISGTCHREQNSFKMEPVNIRKEESMQVKMSEYLTAVKPDMQKLVELLKKDFAYVSVLCTDVTGTTYLVGQRQTSVGDYGFNERGFVVRVYENSCYMEYSFNEYEDIEELAATITGYSEEGAFM